MGRAVTRQRLLVLAGVLLMSVGPTIATTGSWFASLWTDHLLATLLFLAGASVVVFAYRHEVLSVLGITTAARLKDQVREWLNKPNLSVSVKSAAEAAEWDAEWRIDVAQAVPTGAPNPWHFQVLHRRANGTVTVRCQGGYDVDQLSGIDRKIPNPEVSAFHKEMVIAVASAGNVSLVTHKLSSFEEGAVAIEVDQEISVLDEYQFQVLVHTARRSMAMIGAIMTDFATQQHALWLAEKAAKEQT